VPAGIAAVVSAVLVGWVTGIAYGGASTPDRSSTSAPDAQGWEYGEAAPTAANCPIQQNDPPYFPPAHPGDSVVFVGDITLPDCTHVRRGARVVKDWRFKNDGTVPWAGYMLRRLDLPQLPNQCQTLDDIPVAYTAPGHFVDVVVEVTAPPTPGFCFVRFKLIDGAGRVAFPGNRPVNFQLIVD
jgi:hypothetical protein